MLNAANQKVRERLFTGNFGLEKESLRILGDATLSHTPHPFPNDRHIVKDFCENQTEINTGVHQNAQSAVDELIYHTGRIYEKLLKLPEREYLWLFSNPPYIANEEDIPVAVFEGKEFSKSVYRNYLSDKYGRYRMTFSGIHVNFSFSDELLQADYQAGHEGEDFRAYKDRLYLDLAERMAAYSWLLVSISAASPVMDSSFIEKGVHDQEAFLGMGSVRCSEMGYWNEFAPVFDYSGIDAYAGSIRHYVNRGFLRAPSELYYPIRLKPPGENSLEALEEKGVNHIELRMYDLNPLVKAGVDVRDIQFAHLMMIWLASTPRQPFDDRDQVQAVQNFKNAARYDLKTVKILTPAGETFSVQQAALNEFDFMKEFYDSIGAGTEVYKILDFERQKLIDPEKRYAWQIRHEYGQGFTEKALTLAKERALSYV